MKKNDSTYNKDVECNDFMRIQEPMNRLTGDEFADIIPHDILSSMAENAVSEHCAGRSVYHSQLVNNISMEMGWK